MPFVVKKEIPIKFKFTGTRGGTELGIRLDNTLTDLSQADWGQSMGAVHLAGNLTLNYVKVRCVADVDVAALEESGFFGNPTKECSLLDCRRFKTKRTLPKAHKQSGPCGFPAPYSTRFALTST